MRSMVTSGLPGEGWALAQDGLPEGAAFLAGLAVGFWKSQEELQKLWQPDKTFSPAMEEGKREKLVHFWHKAVERTKNWEE